MWIALGVGFAAAASELPGDPPGAGIPSLDAPGPLLRRAVVAREQGDAALAERLLREVAARHPIVADHADLMRLRLLVESGRVNEAIAMHGTWEHTESPLQADFLALLGDAYAARGDEIAARSAWEFARLETEDGERLAGLHLASGRSYERAGELATAAESFLRVWTSYPLSPEAEVASERLDALERELGRRFRTGLAWRKRGDALYRRRSNEEALAAYERALASGELSKAQGRRARSQRAETLFRLRRYPEAARAFGELPRNAETRIAQARSWARAGEVERGARELEKIGAGTRGTQGARATLLAALLWDGEGQKARAARLYQKVVRRGPHSSYARGALWRLGWAAYRDQRWDDAIGYLQALEARDEDPIGALRARYWQARAMQHAGREGAEQSFAAMAREYPFTYYGWRARSRAASDVPPAEPVEVRPGTNALDDAALERPRILLEAGLVEPAREELDRLFLRARGLSDRLALAQLYSNAGDFNRPQRLMVDAYVEQLARGPAPAQLEMWWHAWPAPFAEEVRDATTDMRGVDAALVYSIMREESGYRPEVVSVSGARGLLQLMPTTAEKLATELPLAPFSEDDLFIPRVNIKLGSAYLQQLLDRFEGRSSAAIGSYNAGPKPVARWLRKATGEDDEFVESIAYDQTRAYVKRVLRSLYAYRVLY